MQETLNNTLSVILNRDVYVIGAGRTDTGVHAREMWAHFDVEEPLSENMLHRLNSFLPQDIAVRQILPVADKAHARFDAIERSYEYHIIWQKDPFLQDTAWHLRRVLDVEKMQRAARVLFDYEDFSAFSKSHTQTKTNNCRITKAAWEKREDLLVFHISADRFLRNMVRAIVGTLVEIGAGKRAEDEMEKVIERKDRRLAGDSAPARGLFLTSVKYPKEIFDGKG